MGQALGRGQKLKIRATFYPGVDYRLKGAIRPGG